MEKILRPWRTEDAVDLAAALNNRKILDNLRDGLPYPYTPADAAAYIAAMETADPKTPGPTPSRRRAGRWGASVYAARGIFTFVPVNWVTM